MTERMLNWPESSAIAVVSALKVEPISKVAAAMRLMRSGLSASAGLFGSKSGAEASASTSPLVISSTSPAPAFAPNFSIALASSICRACWMRMSSVRVTGCRF
ncbi:hypothetical protein D9M72_569420 [compost metagenome]